MLLVHDALLLQTTKQTNVNLRLTDYVRLNDALDSNNYWILHHVSNFLKEIMKGMTQKFLLSAFFGQL